MSLVVAKSGGAADAPNRCVPLDKRCVELFFSAFGAHSRPGFAVLRRSDRHHLAACVLQHAAGMRFGHFIYRKYKVQDFQVDGRDGALRLMTDWHRFSGRAMYCLAFEAFPTSPTRKYELRDQRGNVVDTVSPATVLSWHFDILREAGESCVFEPIRGAQPSAELRTDWLRRTLRSIIPVDESAARALIDEVSPHSFRPGLAGDLLREGMRLDEIAIQCRWHGTRNPKMYASRPPLSAFLRSAAFVPIVFRV